MANRKFEVTVISPDNQKYTKVYEAVSRREVIQRAYAEGLEIKGLIKELKNNHKELEC